jgi:hypothetical protein
MLRRRCRTDPGETGSNRQPGQDAPSSRCATSRQTRGHAQAGTARRNGSGSCSQSEFRQNDPLQRPAGCEPRWAIIPA